MNNQTVSNTHESENNSSVRLPAADVIDTLLM